MKSSSPIFYQLHYVACANSLTDEPKIEDDYIALINLNCVQEVQAPRTYDFHHYSKSITQGQFALITVNSTGFVYFIRPREYDKFAEFLQSNDLLVDY